MSGRRSISFNGRRMSGRCSLNARSRSESVERNMSPNPLSYSRLGELSFRILEQMERTGADATLLPFVANQFRNEILHELRESVRDEADSCEESAEPKLSRFDIMRYRPPSPPVCHCRGGRHKSDHQRSNSSEDEDEVEMRGRGRERRGRSFYEQNSASFEQHDSEEEKTNYHRRKNDYWNKRNGNETHQLRRRRRTPRH